LAFIHTSTFSQCQAQATEWSVFFYKIFLFISSKKPITLVSVFPLLS
jgi:hypothetical protein